MRNNKIKIFSRNFSFFDKVNRNWETSWEKNITPWDTQSITQPLKEEFQSKFLTSSTSSSTSTSSNLILNSISNSFSSLNIKNKRALVPGCGSGYDCEYLSKQGFYEVIGIDISLTAIKLCQNKFHTINNLHFECTNFFTYQNNTKFDFIFDYLFFSALDLNMRDDWGKSMKNLIQPKTGILFTLIFPNQIGVDPTIGPPYNVNTNDYKVL